MSGSIPVKLQSGCYFAPDEQLGAMEAAGQIAFRYAPEHNPNGSVRDIAGVTNEAGNVIGLMPSSRARRRSADRI